MVAEGLLLLLGPLIGGGVIGSLVRRIRRPAWRRALLATAAIGGVEAGALLALAAVGAGWDMLLAGVSFGAGTLLTGIGRPPRPGDVLLGAGVLLVTSLLAEGAVRLMLPPPPTVAPPIPGMLRTPEQWRRRCRGLYPDEYRAIFDQRAPTDRDVPVALHVGDSLVEGTGAPPFAYLLNDDGGLYHVNAGFSGTGPDYYLEVVRQWTARLNVRAVVVYIFLGNDLDDLHKPYPCCAAQPLLDYSGPGAPRSRCPEPDWAMDVSARLSMSPAPTLARALADISAAAGHATALFQHLSRHLASPPPGISAPATAERLGRIFSALQEEAEKEGARLAVVLLPQRTDLRDGAPPDTETVKARRWIATLAAERGLTLLDPFAEWREMVQRYGETLIFDSPGAALPDPHLARKGHELFAAWLRRELGRHGLLDD